MMAGSMNVHAQKARNRRMGIKTDSIIQVKDSLVIDSLKLLEERQVVVVPGTAFGEFGEGYIRLSYATSMQCLEQGLQELEEFVRSHETEGDPA